MTNFLKITLPRRIILTNGLLDFVLFKLKKFGLILRIDRNASKEILEEFTKASSKIH